MGTVGAPNDELITQWALMAARRDGRSQAAFEHLVRATQLDVWRLCARMTEAQQADDLTQDTFLRVWKSLSSFRADASARTWVLGVARHVIADHVRRKSRRARLAVVAANSEQAEAVDAGRDPSQRLATTEFLRVLDDDRRLAFVLTQMIGLSYAEAAQVCDVPIGTIRSRVARAREELVEVLRLSDLA